MIILNKSIVGHPVDSLRKIIHRFQFVPEINGLHHQQMFLSRQCIVIESSPDLGYDGLFTHKYKKIQCKMNGNEACVVYE